MDGKEDKLVGINDGRMEEDGVESHVLETRRREGGREEYKEGGVDGRSRVREGGKFR